MKNLHFTQLLAEVLNDKIEDVVLLIDESGKILGLNESAIKTFAVPAQEIDILMLSDLFGAKMIPKFKEWKSQKSNGLFKFSYELNSHIRIDFETLSSNATETVLIGKKIRKLHQLENETTKLLELLEKEINLDGENLEQLLIEENIDKLKLIAENTNDIICLHHPSDGRYLYATPSTERIMGYTSKDLEGKIPYDFIHPEHLPDLSKNLDNTINGYTSTIEKIELKFRKKDGSYDWFEGYTKPIKNKKGEVILLLSCTRNIHERKLVEIERKEREFVQQNLLASSILLNKKRKIMKKLKSKVLEVEPSIREELRKILNYIKETLELEDNLEGFMGRFEKIYPNFYKHLSSKDLNLTNQEMQHLAFIKLGMTSSEISKVMSVKKESLRVLRWRLKKKLGDVDNLSDYVNALEV